MELAMQQEKAKQLRADIIKMLYLCQSGHPGGSLSLVEMLMACLLLSECLLHSPCHRLRV